MNVRMIVRLVVALAVGAFTGIRGYDAAAQSTPTPTPQPVVAIGSSSGPPSSQVTIAISLTNNGANIVTVAPLVFTFDPTVLTFGSCSRAAGVSSGKSVSTSMQVPGQVKVVLQGDLVVIPDGDMIDCTFTINTSAPLGSSPLTFVSADLSDAQFNDYFAHGTD